MLMHLDFRENVIKNILDDKLTSRVRLFTGYKCNYNCGFCFYKGQKPQPFHQGIRRQASICKINNIDSLDLSGGEPTIIPDWFDTLEYLRNAGFKNIAAITNGSTFCDKDFFKRSIDSGMNEVLFSYHAPSENVHDDITGNRGSYRNLFNAMSNAVDLGIKLRINTVVTKNNFTLLPMIATDMLNLQPDTFNFLPFRLENQSTPDNMVSYTESIKFIKESIDIMSSLKTFISVRYIPFCVMDGYEKYVSGWLQKLFDPYEWSQHSFECMEFIRLGQEVPGKYLIPNNPRIDQEFAATYDAIKATSGYSISECIHCSHKMICEGIWRSYYEVYGSEELVSVEGEFIRDILHYRREYMKRALV